MQKSSTYFNEARPFRIDDDACLLDALEQSCAMSAECDIHGGLAFYAKPDANGEWWIEVNGMGDSILGHGKTIREAMVCAFNDAPDPWTVNNLWPTRVSA